MCGKLKGKVCEDREGDVLGFTPLRRVDLWRGFGYCGPTLLTKTLIGRPSKLYVPGVYSVRVGGPLTR